MDLMSRVSDLSNGLIILDRLMKIFDLPDFC